ncbi:hypothetical protein 000TH008_155 [Bacillus phage 000TH008]|nr:hypothetical protein 000TH008_155 [Bacillus phage 000TH008]QQO40849.1 hypothetical protein 000TH009_155 [Bacillus phage 000TH009]
MKTFTLYQNKKVPWKWVVLKPEKYEKPFFFNFKWTPGNTFMTWPRFHCMINLYFLLLWRDNSGFRIGVGLGKKKYSLVVHH